MADCLTCKQQCGYSEYFPMGIITFCRPQIMFLVGYIQLLRDGIYPPNPEPTSYISPDVRVQPRQVAAFTKPAELAAEIDCRLKTVSGMQRRLFELELEVFPDIEDISQYSRDVLNYISGWRRRYLDFTQWKYEQKRGGIELTKPCEKCGNNRWKTIRKNQQWRCRKCGGIRTKSF